MRTSRTIIMAAVVAATLPASWADPSTPAGGSSQAHAAVGTSAAAVASALQNATVPSEAWKQVKGLKFTVTITKLGASESEWNYLWDVKSGQCRIESREKGGAMRTFILADLNSAAPREAAYVLRSDQYRSESGPQGDAERRWVRIPDLSGRHSPTIGRERFTKDTFWLLAPLKLSDPSAKLVLEGTEKMDGKSYDVLRLTLEKPGKIYRGAFAYHLYVNQSTHLIDRWKVAYLDPSVQAAAQKYGDNPDAPAGPIDEPQLGVWHWNDWKKTGPLDLAMERAEEDGDYAILYRNVELLSEIPAGTFDPPAGAKRAPKVGGTQNGAHTGPDAQLQKGPASPAAVPPGSAPTTTGSESAPPPAGAPAATGSTPAPGGGSAPASTPPTAPTVKP